MAALCLAGLHHCTHNHLESISGGIIHITAAILQLEITEINGFPVTITIGNTQMIRCIHGFVWEAFRQSPVDRTVIILMP